MDILTTYSLLLNIILLFLLTLDASASFALNLLLISLLAAGFHYFYIRDQKPLKQIHRLTQQLAAKTAECAQLASRVQSWSDKFDALLPSWNGLVAENQVFKNINWQLRQERSRLRIANQKLESENCSLKHLGSRKENSSYMLRLQFAELQALKDANAKLTTENARLRALTDTLKARNAPSNPSHSPSGTVFTTPSASSPPPCPCSSSPYALPSTSQEWHDLATMIQSVQLLTGGHSPTETARITGTVRSLLQLQLREFMRFSQYTQDGWGLPQALVDHAGLAPPQPAVAPDVLEAAKMKVRISVLERKIARCTCGAGGMGVAGAA